MTSRSRAAQEQLAELEKRSAPFEDQLVEAAKFVGIELDTLLQNSGEGRDNGICAKLGQYFGREEWLLRWLLKKLQTPSDAVPRKTASSWTLLLYLLRTIPTTNGAKILVDRNFSSILRLTLEDLAKDGNESTPQKNEEKKTSKKRKRSGEVIQSSSSTALPRILGCIYAVVGHIAEASNILTSTTTNTAHDGRGTAFSAEFMQTVIRTSSEEAAKILGAWMHLCEVALPSLNGDSAIKEWLSPFITIWSSRAVDVTAYLNFSLHCTKPVLALLREFKNDQHTSIDWVSQLERLIARDIMNPAKAAKVLDNESQLLSALTKTSILQDLSNAPLLFEVAIRSIKPHGSRRRRSTDDEWLLHVFKTLKESMPPRASKDGKHIATMLQLAIHYKVMLDLPVLRAITSEFALPEGDISWELLATMIKLDANVFLIQDKESEKNLLGTLLARITQGSIAESWPEVSHHVVTEVVVPLMKEFAKARDLSGFIHHWYSQLVEFEKLREGRQIPSFSAWENEALQDELRNLFEASLTIQQIEQILEWLSAEAKTNPNAVCVVLDGIAGSLVGETVIDTVGLRLYQIMFDEGTSTRLNDRYRWRSYRTVSRTINCTTYTNVDKVLVAWQEQLEPFAILSKTISNQTGPKIEYVEMTKLICSLWSAPESKKLKDSLVKPVIFDLLRTMARMVKKFIGDKPKKKRTEKADDEMCNLELMNLERSSGWMICSLVRCIMVDYPKAISVGLELEGEEVKGLLQDIFWLCSISGPSWLKINEGNFPAIWLTALAHDDVLCSQSLTETMVDILLSNQTNYKNPILASATTNKFAVKALLGVRMESLNKKQRETILKGWVPTGDVKKDARRGLSFANALDPAVLSLKIKMTEYAMFYEGMEFEDFIHLANAMEEIDDSSKEVSLTLLKEFCRRMFEYVHTIPKETRNKAYISSAFKIVQKKLKKATKKQENRLEYPFIVICEVVLKALLDAKTSVIDNEDLKSSIAAFKSHLLTQLNKYYSVIKDPNSTIEKDEQLQVVSIVAALSTFGLSALEVAELPKDRLISSSSSGDILSLVSQFNTLIFTAIRQQPDQSRIDEELSGGVETLYNRQAIIQRSKALTTICEDNTQRLALLHSIIGDEGEGLSCPEKLLAARQIIMLLEDTGKTEENEEELFDLSQAYSMLCGHLWKTNSIVQFSIISETLQLMLHTKGRSISQFNIDTTLGSISILCSRNGPALPPCRANTIYTHLCHLMRAVLLNHRLKLQGHMHLVVQTMQSLLRCLFRPLPHTAPSSKFGSPPHWLSSNSSLPPLAAESYTRLLTLLCDPTESAVRGKRQSMLVSASEKWKKVAGWHMQFVLMEYVTLQLEMRMESSLREKLVPGIYAVFDTTSIESRRAIGSRLDSSQRAVFGGLVRDYLRFGKWKGL